MTRLGRIASAGGNVRTALDKLLGLTAVWIMICLAGGVCAHAQDAIPISGVTEAIDDVTLSSWVDGTISRVFYEEGAAVTKGEPVLELYKTLEELEVKRRKLIWESKVEKESAAKRVATLGALLEDTRNLYESTGSVSKEELNKNELEYELAVAEMKQLEIVEKRERIEYQIALENLYKRSLRSPIDGTVSELMLEEGEYCEVGRPLVRVVNTKKCLLVCHVEEPVGRTLTAGDAVGLQIQVGTGQVAKKGTVVFVSSVVDPASGLLKVKVEFENRDGAVRPGVSGTMLLGAPAENS